MFNEMPIPVSPVIPGVKLPEVVYAKDQPEYRPLPVVRYEDGTVLMRWKISFRDRLRILFFGNVYTYLMTFNKPLQPIKIVIEKPEMESE